MAQRFPVLTTTIAVLRALGGTNWHGPVAALTGADAKNVDNWQRAETFPARYFLVMWFALSRKGFDAPPSLWKQVVPAQRRKALQAMIAAATEKAA